jgi:hypothetical protein
MISGFPPDVHPANAGRETLMSLVTPRGHENKRRAEVIRGSKDPHYVFLHVVRTFRCACRFVLILFL